MARAAKQNFHIDGPANHVIKVIADSFVREKARSRRKAMDNLQSRLLANAVVLMEAGYIDFEKLLGKVSDLEKTTVQKEASDRSGMDKLEAFMQGLKDSPIEESAPIAAPTVPNDDEDDELDLIEEDGSEEIEEYASPPAKG